MRDRVFERFYRDTSKGAADSHTGGIGMGLAIAKGIVEAHDGHIWIEDRTTGHGARIVFTVPVGDDDPARTTNGNTRRSIISGESLSDDLNRNGE